MDCNSERYISTGSSVRNLRSNLQTHLYFASYIALKEFEWAGSKALPHAWHRQ